jgi:hypothetical protein
MGHMWERREVHKKFLNKDLKTHIFNINTITPEIKSSFKPHNNGFNPRAGADKSLTV